MFRKILVAVGGSDDAGETVPVIAGLARAFDSEVLVVHMRERIVSAAATIESETIPESFQFGEEVAQQLMKLGIPARSDTQGHRPEFLARFILDKAREFGAELIVVGGHHAHGVRERVFGDLGKDLVHGASCPVLMMPSGPHQ